MRSFTCDDPSVFNGMTQSALSWISEKRTDKTSSLLSKVSKDKSIAFCSHWGEVAWMR